MGVEAEALAIITPAAAQIVEAQEMITALAVNIRTQTEADEAGRWIDILAAEVKELEERWSTITKPLHQAHKAAIALAKPAIEPRKEAIQALKDGVAAFVERERKRAEAELAAAAATGDATAIANVTAPSVPKGLSARRRVSYRVVDASAVPREYLMVDHAKLSRAIDEGATVPGVETTVDTEMRRTGR